MTQANNLCVLQPANQVLRKTSLLRPALTSNDQPSRKMKILVIKIQLHVNSTFKCFSFCTSHSAFLLCNLGLITHLFDIKQLNEMHGGGRGAR